MTALCLLNVNRKLLTQDVGTVADSMAAPHRSEAPKLRLKVNRDQILRSTPYRSFSSSGNMKPWISIPAILALVYRARSRNSLTPLGIAAAVVTALVHSIHPWSVFLALLAVFFLAGTIVTKVSSSSVDGSPSSMLKGRVFAVGEA
jgi:Integral membrane protein DUF92